MRRHLTKTVFHPWWRLTRGLTLGVRAVVATQGGEVLLVRHSYVDGWHLPGGGVERGETVLSALARELREEGNVTLEGPPRLHGVFSNHGFFPGDHVVVYVADRWSQSHAPAANAEIRAAEFFPAGVLPSGASPATRRRIAEIFHGAAPVEEW